MIQKIKSCHIRIWMVGLLALLLSGCYHRHSRPRLVPLAGYSERQLDSISFSATHHYTNRYNFVVAADSLQLIAQQPEEYVNGLVIDTFAVKKHRLLVVSDIRMIPQDSIDSVWVQLATEENTFGWTRETELLPSVVPDDPISQFVYIFSNVHLLFFLIIIILISAIYVVKKTFSKGSRIVHFHDIDSPYPMALALTVSTAASFYATIQTFAPDMWRHFYFHPTLNPFAVPLMLGVFLAMVWLIIILAVACVDEVRHRLTFGEDMLYLGGLLAVCAVDYIVFSISSLYFVGYILLIVYWWFAIRRYRRR